MKSDRYFQCFLFLPAAPQTEKPESIPMPLPDIDIRDLIPHRDGMMLIGSILEVDEHRAVTCSVVSDQWPLVEKGYANPILLVELIAQTAGVNNGWARIKKRGLHSDKKGWLVGIKRADFFIDRIPVDTAIEACAENNFEYDNFREIRGTASVGGKIAARVILQVFQP
jgi:predicted hotdog family 3-hydroxylacyl-ACP dehydratase